MKNKILFTLISLCGTLILNAQTWSTGMNTLYANPDTTKVGIGTTNPTEHVHINNGALKIGNGTSNTDRTKNVLKFGDGDYVRIGELDEDDMLSFAANRYNFIGGNVGIGINSPQYKLDVNGKLYLRTYNWQNATAYSYLHWQTHTLVMGVPAGNYSVTKVDIKPGGCTQDSLFSQLALYTAYSPTNQVEKIRFNTMDNCWINTPGYIGIGTTTPQDKLDVRGTIRADAIIVYDASGADFVFDKSYNLRSLNELSSYIEENQHLPEIPSAEEMQQNGVNMNELQMQLLQKVEELTLYIIQQDNRIKELEEQLNR
jgi:hypothetical protein